MRRLAFVALLHLIPTVSAVGGYLKWTFNATNAFFPFAAPFSPAILRGSVPGAERVVTLNVKNNQWQATALDINSGLPVWNALFPDNANNIYPSGVTTGSQYQYLQNPINLAMIQMGGTIVALDGLSGKVAWQWPIPPGITISGVSAWNDTVALLANGQPIVSPYFPNPTTPTILYALDSTTGATRWFQNATTVIPQSQADAASYAVECFIAGEDFLFYSRASKLAGINKKDGSVAWRTGISLEGSVGTGQGANVTHLIYIPREMNTDNSTPPRLLANANNWSFQRFVLMTLNDTNSSAPAVPLWRSKIPETALDNLFYTQPVVDPTANKGIFYYWSNRTDWSAGTDNPTWHIMLVGRDLTTGNELWSQVATPVGLPAVFNGRLMVVTTSGLSAMQGESGITIWQIPGAVSYQYSYNVSPTFGNTTGILVASRCLGSNAPNLCMYSAFEPHSSSDRNTFTLWILLIALLLSCFCCGII